MEKNKSRNKILPVILVIIFFAFSICLCSCQGRKKNKTKVLLIGLDGASWNVIEPLIKEGRLPNIKRLMDRGSRARMKVFLPIESEVIWTSIATGKTPDKHGIIARLMEDPRTGEYVPPSSNLRKAKAIWNILSEKGKKAGVVHYLVTRPPEDINGVMISGNIEDMDQLGYLSADRAYPPFNRLCSQEEFEGFKELTGGIFSALDKKEFPYFWWSIQNIDNFMANFSNYLLRKQDFDFFCLYLRGIDATSHNFWKFSLPEGFNITAEEREKYKSVLSDYYIWSDKVIGSIMAAADIDLVIICSDHGFRNSPDYYLFDKVDAFLALCGLDKMDKAGTRIILKNEPKDYYSFNENIRIVGNITHEELGFIRAQAKGVLSQVKVKETGDYPFADLRDTKDGFLINVSRFYRSPNPDNHVIIKDKEYKISEIFTKRPYSGDHSDSAVLIISGKNIRSRNEVKDAAVYDLTPTILYYFGLAVARDMDGKVLTGVFKEDCVNKKPVRYIDTYETVKNTNTEKPIRYPDDEEKIKERMRSLGYIN
jgi:predicted AlkP superfamily phosphohydrolase/phosphomutase